LIIVRIKNIKEDNWLNSTVDSTYKLYYIQGEETYKPFQGDHNEKKHYPCRIVLRDHY